MPHPATLLAARNVTHLAAPAIPEICRPARASALRPKRAFGALVSSDGIQSRTIFKVQVQRPVRNRPKAMAASSEFYIVTDTFEGYVIYPNSSWPSE